MKRILSAELQQRNVTRKWLSICFVLQPFRDIAVVVLIASSQDQILSMNRVLLRFHCVEMLLGYGQVVKFVLFLEMIATTCNYLHEQIKLIHQIFWLAVCGRT